MPQGHIRKGFFFYFGLFVLLLIAIFMICLVVMMFNPGKSVLWMQYFTSSDSQRISKTTDAMQELDLNNVTDIEINCSYASVIVEKNNEYTLDGLYIVNNAKGFAVSSNATPFDYQVYYEGSTLKVDVTEPTGFMYLSKDIKIILHAAENSSLDFSNLNLTVNTTGGDINIGGTEAKAAKEIKLNSLNASTSSAYIIFTEMFDSSTLTDLKLNTESGKMYSTNEVSVGNQTFKGLVANCDTSLTTNNGSIAFDVINVGNKKLSITCKKGNVAADYIYAQDVEVSCVQGNYKFGSVYGNLDYTNSEDSILAPNIIADYISGNFTISGRDGFKGSAEPDVEINKIDGGISTLVDKGSVIVGEANGAIGVMSENNLKVDITVGENNNATKRIVNANGDVTLAFLGIVGNTVNVETDKGDVVINITSVANFTSTAWLNDLEGTTKLSDDKISVSHGLIEGETKNPLNVRGTSSVSGTMTIKTNASVSYNLVLKDSLASHNLETVVE